MIEIAERENGEKGKGKKEWGGGKGKKASQGLAGRNGTGAEMTHKA